MADGLLWGQLSRPVNTFVPFFFFFFSRQNFNFDMMEDRVYEATPGDASSLPKSNTKDLDVMGVSLSLPVRVPLINWTTRLRAWLLESSTRVHRPWSTNTLLATNNNSLSPRVYHCRDSGLLMRLQLRCSPYIFGILSARQRAKHMITIKPERRLPSPAERRWMHSWGLILFGHTFRFNALYSLRMVAPSTAVLALEMMRTPAVTRPKTQSNSSLTPFPPRKAIPCVNMRSI
jgi:hypothetical protein